MEEHVGYWDSLGWRDPFGRPEHEGRQRTYARVLDDGSVYTPEIVVDGRHIARASSPEQAKLWLTDAAKGPRARLRVSRTTGGYVTIEVTDLPTVDSGDIAELWLALTESKLVSHVERGENAGRVLAHAPVVRLLRRVGTMSDRSMRTTVKVDVDPTWNPANLRAVAFVQLSRARTILGAAAR